jgi:hypothetical protein
VAIHLAADALRVEADAPQERRGQDGSERVRQ